MCVLEDVLPQDIIQKYQSPISTEQNELDSLQRPQDG